jgi:hypothetical protein
MLTLTPSARDLGTTPTTLRAAAGVPMAAQIVSVVAGRRGLVFRWRRRRSRGRSSLKRWWKQNQSCSMSCTRMRTHSRNTGMVRRLPGSMKKRPGLS